VSDNFAANPITALWAETVNRQPDRVAIFGADGAVLRTFADVENEAFAFAHKHVQQRGEGAVALVAVGNHPSLPALIIALWRAGFTIALAEIGAAVELPGIFVRVTRDSGGELVFHWNDCFVAASPKADFLKLTSGTTGAPRGIRFTAQQLVADCESICVTMGITAEDINYGVISWAHSYGFSNLVLPLICRGVPLVATEDRLPRAILRGLEVSAATVFPSVPVFFKKLAELSAAPLPALRLCISAGAPLPVDVARAFRAVFGVKVHSFYGSSECGGICFDGSEDVVAEGFVGAPMVGVQLVENAGRIEVHSPAVGSGYWPSGDDAVLGGGRFIPADLVSRSGAGFTLCGRESDVINVAGRKLNPAEVERVLRQHRSVSDVAVFGVPSSLRGEEPVACIVTNAPVAEVAEFAAARLALWQVPKDFWQVDALPLNERGKLSRRALSAQWLARSGREIPRPG
jgi:long-chain acyl-CoA synthetase